eukprot:GHUV01023973.1.p1 GENE.GHUV01023973.1~~GHUV01023973.1.p1  ORF type:complete len:213 (+),score=58.02 GHUV01023973.1:171-809(+)
MQTLRQLPVLLSRAAVVQQRQQSSLAVAAPIQKLAVGAKYVFGVGAAYWAYQSEEVAEHARLAYLIPTRLARDVAIAVSIVADYKTTLNNVPAGDPEGRQQQLSACHKRNADRLLKLCFDNGGIYIKLGQHIGQLDHLLPEEYVLTMRQHMLDKCPVSSYSEVRQIIHEDLGAPPEALFKQFSETPIASASLAQVSCAEDNPCVVVLHGSDD